MDPYAHTKYDTAKRAAIMKVVTSQGHEGVLLDPDWLQQQNIRLDFEAKKGRGGATEICPVIKQLDPNRPAYISPDPNASFVRTILPNAACNPKYLGPKRISLEAGEYPLSSTSKQRLLIDPKSDTEDYGKRAIAVIKEWQGRAVTFLANNPHLHDLVSPVTGKPATAAEISAILRNKSDTSFRPMIDETMCEEGDDSDKGTMYLHNRPFKARGKQKGDPLTSFDPATETILKHPDFEGEVGKAFEAVVRDAGYNLKLKPIMIIMPDGKTISYGDRIFDGAIGSFRVSFGPLHVRKDGRNSQMTFTHYCDRITLITNGPDPEPCAGSNFMAMFNSAPVSRAPSPAAVRPGHGGQADEPASAASESVSNAGDSDCDTVVEEEQDTDATLRVSGSGDDVRDADPTDSGDACVDEQQQASTASDKKRKRLAKLSKKTKKSRVRSA